MSAAPHPLILDVDTGIDDALALALAVRSPGADLVAATTLAGNVDVEHTTANTVAVLAWLGASDVPVYRGASRPLVRPHKHAAHVHGETGLGNAALPPARHAEEALKGPAALIRMAQELPGELTLVCTGPLTNLAIALNVEPRLPELLRRLVVMGGAFGVSGNITPYSEFNIHEDPEAAAQVFAAPWPEATVVGLDVTHQVALPKAVWDAAAGVESPAAELVVQILRRTFTERGVTGFYLHDPLALGVALDPSLVGGERAAITVTTQGERRGETWIAGPGPFLVAKSVDAPRFLRRFCELLDLPTADLGQQGLRPE